MGLHTVMLIKDAGLQELIRDLLPGDEVRAVWPPDEAILKDPRQPIQLLVVDEDDLPEGSPLAPLIRRGATELPTIILSSHIVAPRRQETCLTVPKPIPLPVFFSFVDSLRRDASQGPDCSEPAVV